jgi:hypothetical protein
MTIQPQRQLGRRTIAQPTLALAVPAAVTVSLIRRRSAARSIRCRGALAARRRIEFRDS